MFKCILGLYNIKLCAKIFGTMCKNFVNLSASVIELLLKTKNSKLISKLKKKLFPHNHIKYFYGSNDKSNDSNAPLHIFVNCFMDVYI